jgi:DNA modification methylase
MKLTKEDIDKVRHIEGFPIAKDEDIIALSNPPYYTACPNPFIEDFIKEHGKPYDEATDDYHREPFAADVSEGKNDPIYNAHSYHTKVPYKAIMRYILHYTEPGDIVFDGFCGTGMTGVAAQMCGNPDAEFKHLIESEMPNVKWGIRKAVLNDLSPAASFISYNYNSAVDLTSFKIRLKQILDEFEREYGWIYETYHNNYDHTSLLNDSKGKINYVIWSDVLICPQCGNEIIFWDAAVDEIEGKVKEKFSCNECNAKLTKNECTRAISLSFDKELKEQTELTKQVPVLINYSYMGKRYTKKPDQEDIALIDKIDNMNIKYWYPSDLMMHTGSKWGDSWRAGYHQGMSRVNHFFYKRSLIALSYFYSKFRNYKEKFLFTSILFRASKLFKWSKNQAGPLSGTLYISSCIYETSICFLIKNKENIFDSWEIKDEQSIINCGSSTDLDNFPKDSIDYIFTDPPFGDNLNYSELSFLWEAWLKVKTNNQSEAIMNKSQNKGLLEYQELMTKCFSEYYRILKPNRWMTVVFHNSKNAVWNAIQESLLRSGFIIADVRTLDKKQGSFKQVNNTSAVKQDLVISAYKPKESFKRDFISHAGSEETAWSFVRQHLENLPVVVVKNGKIELIAERQAFLLYDRMVAYHIMNGIAVPLDATDFYKGLDERFMKRDGMYFLADQVNEYDTARIVNDVEPVQFELFVTNEKSAIAWLYQQLETPQTYAELQPKFMQEIKAWDKFEVRPELAVLLEENFLQDDKGRWYIPDITKAADVAKLREKKLLKEFEGYLATKGKLKLFRTEAIRVGFAKLWADKNYKLIVETAERLPESVIQEDDKLLMYYDISLGRL